MNKKVSVLTILLPLVVLGAILPGQIIPRAHAVGQGLVCVAQVTDINSNCPVASVGPTFNGPVTAPNSLLRVPIMINNTDPFLGLDITVNSSDITKLKPYGVDLTGSLMPANSITLALCIGGKLVTGSICAATDNPTTVHLAIIGPTGFITTPGTTGLLFTAIFSITGTTLPGGVKISYQNGCSTSSSGSLCVALSNGTITPVTESTRGGFFDNSNTATLPYATLTTPTTNLGQTLAGAPSHALPSVTFTATSQNGFNTTSNAQLALAALVNGSGLRPSVLVSPTILDLTSVPRGTFTQTGTVASNVPAGVYVVTATATYQTQDTVLLGTISSLSAAYSLQLNVTDYTINSSPNPVTVQPAGSQPVTVTIAPRAQFNTLVKLGLTIPAATASAGIAATFNAYTISGGSGTSTLTVTTTTSTPAGSYTLTITSNATLGGFTKIHTTILTIKAGGFTISATSPSQAVGTYVTSTVTITYLYGFTGTVALTNNNVTNLSCHLISPTSVTTNATATVSCTSNVIGAYSPSITGTSGPVIRSTTPTFTFLVGFSISASTPASQNIGIAETSTITITYLNSFTGTVLLTNNTVTGLSCQLIAPSGVTATGTASVACLSMVAGTYQLTITGTSGGGAITASATATFTFTNTHDVAIASTSISPSGQVTVGTTITVTVQLQNKQPTTEHVAVTLLVGTLSVQTMNVTVNGNYNRNVTLTWDTSTYAANKYTLTVSIQLSGGETNVESGQQVLSQDIGTSTVNPVSTPPSIDPIIVAIIAGVVVVAAAGALLVLRRRRIPSDVAQPAKQ